MARRTGRVRTRSRRARRDEGTNRLGSVAGLDFGVVPRLVLGAVDGVEVVAVGTLQLARDVLLSMVSGVANVGAEAVTATVAGTRGVVSATSRMVGDIAVTAQDAFLETVGNATRSRRGPVRLPARHAVASADDGPVTAMRAAPRPRRRAARTSPMPRPVRSSTAA